MDATKLGEVLREARRLRHGGDRDRAVELLSSAWDEVGDDPSLGWALAHDLAHAMTAPEDQLRWDLEALRCAAAVSDERIAASFPSLHANAAERYLALGRVEEAATHLAEARAASPALAADDYGRDVLAYIAALENQIKSDA